MRSIATTAAIYVGAAFFEIAGCYLLWMWWRLGQSALWILPAIVSLVLFGWLLTLAPSEAAGRAYAAYGGVYVLASLVWLRAVEGVHPDRWDVIGATVCVLGAAIVLYGPRGA